METLGYGIWSRCSDQDRRKDHAGTQKTFAVAQLMAQMAEYKPTPCIVSHRPALDSGTPKKGRIISARGWGSLDSLTER